LKLITSLKFNNSFKYEENINFKFNTGLSTNKKKIQSGEIFALLEYAFRGMSCLISKPVYMETPQKLFINLFYFLVPAFPLRRRQVTKVKKTKRIKTIVPKVTSLNGISIPGPSSELIKKGNNINNKNLKFGKSINKNKVTGNGIIL
jgi:hypothetical protein